MSETGLLAPISDAVILMAGAGSRLRGESSSLPKPLLPVLGRPLISYTLAALARAGIKKVCAVIGFEADVVVAKTLPLIPAELKVQFVNNPAWEKQNGISVLAAVGLVQSPFLLTMSDHIYDGAVLDVLLRNAQCDVINLAVDRKLDSIFDIDDAMKVQTRGERITEIGKQLKQYDAIDTGLFVCAENIFDYLERAKIEGDCSLADGVRLAAAEGKARVVDIKDGWWQDVDTPEMLAYAEERLRAKSGGNNSSPVSTSPDRRNPGESQAKACHREPEMKNPLRQIGDG